MNRYDPNRAPDAAEWSALDESEQIMLVKQYHKRERVKLPNEAVHAVFHVIVENQIALGEEMNVASTLDRLLLDGLDRHEAIHAIGAVLAGHMHSMLSDDASEFSEAAYAADLDALTVSKWREMNEPDA